MFEHDLILARHGETEWNAIHRMQGRLNSPLTARGQEQARALGDILRALDLDRFDIRISPQGRVVQTAAIALGAGPHPLRSDDRLMEIDIGAWSGMTRAQVQAARPDLFTDDPASRLAWYDAAPGGEGYSGLKRRCLALLADLRGPTILLTHGITLRMLRSLAACGDDRHFGSGSRTEQGVAYLVRSGNFSVLDRPGPI